MEGTYPLPEAQLDRFLLKVLVESPGDDDFTQILRRTTGAPTPPPKPVLNQTDVLGLRALCREVEV
jgi:MoxR-like ATPase